MAGKSDFSPGGERVNPAGQSALDETSRMLKVYNLML